ncbi:MAG: hypothetical protein KDE34_29280, partial [Anaerolineales bacterium]|nr:hypothetical protein [Anaerolineales bacterium]
MQIRGRFLAPVEKKYDVYSLANAYCYSLYRLFAGHDQQLHFIDEYPAAHPQIVGLSQMLARQVGKRGQTRIDRRRAQILFDA